MKLEPKRKFRALFLRGHFLILLSSVLNPPGAFAGADLETIKNLSATKTWLRLLHLEPSKNQVITPRFYLSQKTGVAIDAEVELRLNLERSQSQSSYRCQFPARDEWLRKQFTDIDFAPSVACPELDAWRIAQSLESLSIVYPSQSMENSLSVFSHTFLKFNSAEIPRESNLNLTLGFAAEFDPQDSILKLASMGILGGYIGRFSMTNYYAEINRYGEAESRDIFEYELNFNAQEIQFLLNHLWEIKEAEFRYYFLSGNCSYHLLGLLEIARPELDLSSQFGFVTIPLESLKAVLDKSELLRNRHWLPGKGTREKAIMSMMTPRAASVLRRWQGGSLLAGSRPNVLSMETELASFETEEKIQLLELFSESSRGREELSTIRSASLNFRSRLPAGNHSSYSEIRSVGWPEFSHGSQLLSLGAGSDLELNGRGWAQMRYRFVLHNMMDPLQGYFENMTFEAGDLRIRYSESFRNSSFTLLNAQILKPIEDSFGPMSWELTSKVMDILEKARWQNRGGLGLTKKFGIVDGYIMAVGDTEITDEEQRGVGIFLGASIGAVLRASDKVKFKGVLDRLIPAQSRKKNFWQGRLQGSYAYSTKLSWQTEIINAPQERTVFFEVLTYF